MSIHRTTWRSLLKSSLALMTGVALVGILISIPAKPTEAQLFQPKQAIAIVIDPTASAQAGRGEFVESLTRLVRQGYLAGSTVCVVHACARPHLLYTGAILAPSRFAALLTQATVPCACSQAPVRACGSDPATALLEAGVWLAGADHRDQRRLLLAYTDLRPDPCKVRPHSLSDPAQMRWGKIPIEVHVFGLDASRQPTYGRAWGTLHPAACLHQPHERLEGEHLKLTRKLL